MGASSSHSGITKEQLEEYEELTYLSKAEIVYLIKLFSELDTNLNRRVPFVNICDQFRQLKYNPFNDRICEVFSSYGDGCFSLEDILDLYSVMSENCPDKVKAAWAFRIFETSASKKFTRQTRTLLTSLQARTPTKIAMDFIDDPFKVMFDCGKRATDFDRDNKIGENDLITIIDRLTFNDNQFDKAIPREDKEEIARILLGEMDIESSGKIGALAFQHGVGKMSEFSHSFSFKS